MNRGSRDLLNSNLARSVVDVFEKMVLWKWKDSEDLPKVERIINDLDYVTNHSNKPYSHKVINTAWWWFATGWIQATRLKVGNPNNYLFKVKFYNEEEVELRGQSFVEYMNARKNVNLEYVDALYTRGRFNSKGALKKFLNDEMELNKGEPRA